MTKNIFMKKKPRYSSKVLNGEEHQEWKSRGDTMSVNQKNSHDMWFGNSVHQTGQFLKPQQMIKCPQQELIK